MSLFECRKLVKDFGNIKALDDVSFSIEKGKIVGLLGPNGSGKTTIMKIANGLLTPTSGEVLINGQVPGPNTKKIVSYLPERTYIPDSMNVKQLLNFFSDFYADFSRETALSMMQSLGIMESQPIKQMSKGTREKVQLILVMSRKAQLFLLDEPIGGVDPATRDYIIRTIIGNYNIEASIVISTHLIADVENILDDVLFLNHGKIVLNSSVEDIRGDSGKSVDQMFREVFRC
jgi:ABC-2 type transport system ATP-binding protein